MKSFLIVCIILVIAVSGFYWKIDSWREKTIQDLDEKSNLIETSKGRLEYATLGMGPPVLVLHGGFGGFDQGLLIGEDLAAHGFTVIAPSRAGYLRTPNKNLSIPEQAAMMVALLNILGFEKVDVIGFSAGCPIALEIALKYPDKVKALVLESLGSPESDFPTATMEDSFMAKALLSKNFEDFATWFLMKMAYYFPQMTSRWLFYQDSSLAPHLVDLRVEAILSDPNQMQRFENTIASMSPMSPRRKGLKNDLKNLYSPNTWEAFPYNQIKVPTLVIQARNDKLGSYAEAQLVAEKIDGAQLLTVENNGHLIWLGHVAEWQQALIDFLRKSL